MAYLTKLVLDFLSKLMEKTEDGTYDRSTDSNEAISEAIAGLGGGGLSDKEKSLLGIGVFPGFQDFFNTVANDAYPDSNWWNVLENGGTVTVQNDLGGKPGQVFCQSNSTTGFDAIITTKDKVVFGLKTGVTTIHLKSRVKLSWTADNGDNCGIGLVRNENTIDDITNLQITANHVASVLVSNQVPTAHSSDGAGNETTDLSSWISTGTWFTLEIIISVSDVKFYIDSTLRATHSTRVPSAVWQIVVGSTSEGNAAQQTMTEYVQVWGE